MIDAKEFDRVCRIAGLAQPKIDQHIWCTLDKLEAIELTKDGRVLTFWNKEGERIYDRPVSSKNIQDVYEAFTENKHPNDSNVPEKAKLPIKEPEKKHNDLVIGSISALAGNYGIPAELTNLFFVKFDNQLYIKNPGLLWIASKKGYGHIEITDKFNDTTKEWEAECKIFPTISKEMVEAISKLDARVQEKALLEATKPTNGTGRAGDKNIKMKTMLVFARELAQTRAQNRALRAYTGYGGTSAEELDGE